MIAPADAASNWARRVAALRTQATMRDRSGAAANDLAETALAMCDALVRELAGAQLTRDQLRADLRAADAAWDHLFDAMPCACLLTDRAGVILKANRAASALLNMSASHLKRRELLVFSHDRETFRALLAEVQRNPGAELRARLLLRPRERKQTMTQLHVLPAPGRDDAWLWLATPAAADTTPSLEIAFPADDDQLAPLPDSL